MRVPVDIKFAIIKAATNVAALREASGVISKTYKVRARHGCPLCTCRFLFFVL
jgi:hypothetical protein